MLAGSTEMPGETQEPATVTLAVWLLVEPQSLETRTQYDLEELTAEIVNEDAVAPTSGFAVLPL